VQLETLTKNAKANSMGSTTTNKSHQKIKDFISWFEIPVYNIHRAAAFYNAIYSIEMEINTSTDYAMAYFPADKGIGGALVAGPGCVPNATGVLIYLNAGNDLDSILGRVELAGGRVIMPRTMISEQAGSFALFIDSEGNRLALHEGPPRRVPEAKQVKAATKAIAARPITAKVKSHAVKKRAAPKKR